MGIATHRVDRWFAEVTCDKCGEIVTCEEEDSAYNAEQSARSCDYFDLDGWEIDEDEAKCPRCAKKRSNKK